MMLAAAALSRDLLRSGGLRLAAGFKILPPISLQEFAKALEATLLHSPAMAYLPFQDIMLLYKCKPFLFPIEPEKY